MTQTTPRYADSKWALPYGPGTHLFRQAERRRASKARMDADLAELTPANIAALEAVTAMLFECGYPLPVAA